MTLAAKKCGPWCSQQVRPAAGSDAFKPTTECFRSASAALMPAEILAASFGRLADAQMWLAVVPAVLPPGAATAAVVLPIPVQVTIMIVADMVTTLRPA